MTDDEVNEILAALDQMRESLDAQTADLAAEPADGGHERPPHTGTRRSAQSAGSLRSPHCTTTSFHPWHRHPQF